MSNDKAMIGEQALNNSRRNSEKISNLRNDMNEFEAFRTFAGNKMHAQSRHIEELQGAVQSLQYTVRTLVNNIEDREKEDCEKQKERNERGACTDVLSPVTPAKGHRKGRNGVGTSGDKYVHVDAKLSSDDEPCDDNLSSKFVKDTEIIHDNDERSVPSGAQKVAGNCNK